MSPDPSAALRHCPMEPCPRHDNCRAEGIDNCVPVGLRLRLVPISLAQANEHVAAWHRHNRPVPGAKFSRPVRDLEPSTVGGRRMNEPSETRGAALSRRLVRRPFRGTHYYEWQLGSLVFQFGRRRPANEHKGIIVTPKRGLRVWRDPFWRSA